MGFNSAFKGLKLLKKPRERAFKQFKWPRPQCVNPHKVANRSDISIVNGHVWTVRGLW